MSGETKPLDAGHLHVPRFWPESRGPWAPTPGQCRASVPTPGVMCAFHQCSRKSKVTRTVTHHGEVIDVEYCGQHDPVALREKRNRQQAAWKAKWDAAEAAAAERGRVDALRSDAVDAIKQIANGHNDPRTLALLVLSRNGESL